MTELALPPTECLAAAAWAVSVAVAAAAAKGPCSHPALHGRSHLQGGTRLSYPGQLAGCEYCASFLSIIVSQWT